MATISGYFFAEDRARNGVTIKVYPESAFGGTPPSKGTAFPATGLLATVTTGTTHGGDGSYRATGLAANATFYAGGDWQGSLVWDSHSTGLDSNQKTVLDYGAIGNGLSSDTAAVQAALDDAAVGRIVFPPGEYSCSNLNINSRSNLIIEGQGAKIIWDGTAAAGDQIGLRLKGTSTNITIRNLEFLGDNTAANGHAGVWWKNTDSVQQIRVEDNYFLRCVRGVCGTRTASGTWGDIRISGNYFEAMKGTGSGQGEGVCLTTNATTAINAEITGNTFVSCDQYDVHLSQGVGGTVSGNRFLTHRISTATAGTKAAIRVNRFQDVVIEGNSFYGCYDGCIEITPTLTTTTRSVLIEGNNFSAPGNAVPEITVGSTTPAADGAPEYVTIVGNNVFKNANHAEAVKVNAALRLLCTGNSFEWTGLTATCYGITLQGVSDSGGTATYSDRLQFLGNQLYGSGGTFSGFRLEAAFCTAAAAAFFVNNPITGAAEFSNASSISNANLVGFGQGNSSIGLAGLTFTSGNGLQGSASGPLRLLGALTWPVTATAKTSAYTANAYDGTIMVDSTAGNFNVNLPDATTCPGRIHAVRKVVAANTVTLVPAAGLIDGGANLGIVGLKGYLVQAVGSNWWTLAQL